MRAKAKASAIALVGVLVGIAIADFVWVRESRWLVESAMTHYVSEQEALAHEKQRAGDFLGAARHHLNAADAESGRGFAWIRRYRAYGSLDWSRNTWTSFLLLIDLDPYMTTGTEYERVRRQLESWHRVKAALALEAAGESRLAEAQWRRVAALYPEWTEQQQRDFAVRPDVFGPEYHRALLESETWDDFFAALSEIREVRFTGASIEAD